MSKPTFIDDMGDIAIIGVVLVLSAAILILQGILCKKFKLIEKLKAKLLWNAFIRFSLQYYLKAAFVTVTALSVFSKQTKNEKFKTLVTMSILVLLPNTYAVFMLYKRKTMTLDTTKAKFGSLF